MIMIYCDGACSGNPGPGGWAYVVMDPMIPNTPKFIKNGGERNTTNNRMEIKALIESLRYAINAKLDSITVFSDSSYVVKSVNDWMSGWYRRGWVKADGKPVKNAELWIEVRELLNQISLNLIHCKAHCGIFGNEVADRAAVEAIAHFR